MKKILFFILGIVVFSNIALAQTPSRSGITVETQEAEQGQIALNLEGYLSNYRPLAQNDSIQVWFRVREKGSVEWGAVGGQTKRNQGVVGFSPTFIYAYTGVFTGTGCTELEYQAIAQYTSVLRSTYQNPPEYDSGINTFNLTAISNRPNAPLALGEIKTFVGGREDCEEDPGPSTTGGGSTQTTEGSNTYRFLTPLPVGEGLDPQDSVEIGVGEGGIFGILQRIFTIMLVVAIVLAVVFMIIGGARYATGDTIGGKMGGREVITNAIKGLLFALLAWLLLNIINPDLLRFTLEIPNIGKGLSPGTGSATSTGTISGEGCGPDVSDEECFARIEEDEPNVRERFESANIAVVGTQSGEVPCESFGERGCTMVGLLSNTTISNLIAVKNECVAANPQCKMQITGGTEYWNHGSGRGGNHGKFIAVDLQLQGGEYTVFNNFIKSKTSTANPFSACRETYTHRGLRFCNENGNHWHVDTVTSAGGGGQTTSGSLIEFENIGVGNNGVWGKASGRPISTGEVSALVSDARSKSWYSEVQRVAGSNAKILTAIIMVESSGDPTKERTEPDGKKSCGLGQLLTDTAKGLDSALRNKSVTEICTALKEPNYNIRLSNQYYRSLSGDFKKKVAAYNGGVGNQGATGSSEDCPGIMRFECPWDEIGCYDPDKPNDRPADISCAVNTGYEVTRFYVDKVKKISDQL